MDRRAVRSEAFSVLAGAAACHAWCAAVLWTLGHPPASTAFLALPSLLVAAVVAADRIMARAFPLLPGIGAAGSCTCGFAVAAAAAAAAIRAVGELPAAPGNLADLALAGLVFGIPGGLAAWLLRPDESIVDSRSRRL